MTGSKVSARGEPCQRIIAVDARTLAQTGKGIPRFLFETLREIALLPGQRVVLFSNKPLHPDNALPIETVIDHAWRKVPGTLWMMARLNRLAKRFGADTIWGPAHVLPPSTRGLRTVLTVHDLVYHIMPSSMSRWNRFVSRLLVDASIRRADRIVADSETTKHDVMSLVDATRDDIDVIYLGARSAPAGVISAAPRTTGDNYLFALGSIEPRKNIDGLLGCFKSLRRLMPGLTLRLTGGHSWGSAETLERIRKTDGCELLGFLSDSEVARQMAGARCFIMPSHYEGFGLPVIEAVDLAPVVISDIPIFRELSRSIDGICLVDFADPDLAAATIANFLANRPAPARFAPGAEQTFRWPSVARAYARVFNG